ncbi:bifunctional glmU domain protein [Mycobacterium xenopi 4042]|uniref:Bifunctional glmU domain protein n=1 Tax=Mycobacterium xenopi 4042 TaxID=1299334 RepID=X8AEI6_MYCXE|nr:bifunctional glmU domain protein [Mycobacterium xenopi 4042]
MLTTTLADPTGYGRILRTQDNEVIAIVEQADATPSQKQIREVNAGSTPSILRRCAPRWAGCPPTTPNASST